VWTVREEPVESPAARSLLRAYFTEIVERYFRRAATRDEIDATLAEYPSTGFAAFLVLRTPSGEPAGCVGLHPTGELTRFYVAAPFRRAGGASALLASAESKARALGLTHLHLDTRADLLEARTFYRESGFTEIPPPSVRGPYQDHFFTKPL
jgi:GNAT superfamily N-acetyltransferase